MIEKAPGRPRCHGLGSAVLLLLLIAGTSLANESVPGPILRPAAVILHIHDEISDQRFVERLVALLQSNLAPPITASPVRMDLERFRLRFGIMDANPLLGTLISGIDWQRDRNVVHFVLIPDDMRLQPARFNFAASAGDAGTPFHLSIVSLARLQQLSGDGRVDSNPSRTAVRAFKLIAKNTARLMGYASSDRCLFAFARSIAELDATAESFCEPDLSTLVAAGIARVPQ